MRQPIPLRVEHAPSLGAALRRRPPRELRLGGLTPFTTIDFPGKLSAVLFVQGCPWRCGYCHNPHLQARTTAPALAWSDTLAWLSRRVGLIDGVVFSGGEPTVDPMLESAITEVRALGFAIGLHSAGTHPRRLKAVLPLIDWVGLDVKAPLDDPSHCDHITGRKNSAAGTIECLEAVLASACAYEVRTTAHPLWLDDTALQRLGSDLARRGVQHHVLQIARPTEHSTPPPVPDSYPAPDTLAHLQTLFRRFEVRRG